MKALQEGDPARAPALLATHLLESGVDVTVVQWLLGHASLAATLIYTHVSVEHVGRVRSPLDLLGTPAAQVADVLRRYAHDHRRLRARRRPRKPC